MASAYLFHLSTYSMPEQNRLNLSKTDFPQYLNTINSLTESASRAETKKT